MDYEVDVLLASYNGAKYIRTQLDSILQQETEIPFRVVVSDDGSQDGTVEIVREYARRFPNLVLLAAAPERLGVVRNFERLCEYSDANYIMFSDQDDVWDADKLKTCIDFIKSVEKNVGDGPCLIYGDMVVIDGDSNTVHHSHTALNAYRKQVSLNELLIDNSVSGCAATLNRSLRDVSLPFPREAYLHDWWMALVAKSVGTLWYMDKTIGKYRVHASNTVGVNRTTLSQKLGNFFIRSGTKGIYKVSILQARALRKRLHELSSATKSTEALVEAYIDTDTQNPLRRKLSLIQQRFLPYRRLKRLSTVFGLW